MTGGGGGAQNYNKQNMILSDKGVPESNKFDFLSHMNGNTAMKNYRQTPSSFNQDQILSSSSG